MKDLNKTDIIWRDLSLEEKTMNLNKSLDRIDSLIRQARQKEALSLLGELPKKTKLKEAIRIAGLHRRLGKLHQAIKILNPWIRLNEGLSQDPEALTEYAASLIRLNLCFEAREILNENLLRTYPRAYLQLGFLNIYEFDHERAILSLREALNYKNLFSNYEILTAKINLASALIGAKDFFQAQRLLQECQREASQEGHLLLKSNANELLTSCYVELQEWDLAQQHIDEAKKNLSSLVSIDADLIRLQEALFNYKRSPTEARRAELTRLRQQIFEAEQKEVLNELDLHVARATGDRRLAKKIILGTPFRKFQRRLIQEFEFSHEELRRGIFFSEETPGSWELIDSPEGFNEILDLDQLTWKNSPLNLGYNQVPHRILKAFLRDRYFDPSLTSLFVQAYPEEHFNPRSSVDKTHQALRRLREGLSAGPVEIIESKGRYQIRSTGPGLVIKFDSLLRDLLNEKNQDLLEFQRFSLEERLRKFQSFSGSQISRTQWQKLFGLSERSASRELQSLEKLSLLQRQGSGPKTLYRISQSGDGLS